MSIECLVARPSWPNHRVMNCALRSLGRALVVLLLALAVPALAAAIAIPRATASVYPAPGPRDLGADGGDRRADSESGSDRTTRLSQPRTVDPTRPVVAIVLGEEGANVADTLVPFEVFGRAGAFDTVMVAPTADPVPLTGGLDVVPDLTFAELDRQLGRPADIIVVPQIHGSTDQVLDWLRTQRADGAPLVLSVCVGAGVIADAGLLEGRRATSHWLGLIGLRRSHPEVEWVEGERFVDTGSVITSAGVLSGIDGSLRVVERLAGTDTARRVRDEIHWDGYLPSGHLAGGSTRIEASSPSPGDLPPLLSAAFRWNRPTSAVLLTEGVGEIELASAFRPRTELSYLSTLRTVTPDGAPVTSAHGLTFVPRSTWPEAADDVDRLLVPGARAAETGAADALAPHPTTAADPANGARTAYLHENGDEFAFDGALRDIAATTDRASASWVAKSLQYPLPALPEDADVWPWGTTLTAAALAALGGVLGWLLLRLWSGRFRTPRQRSSGCLGSATETPRSAHGTPDAASPPTPVRSGS